ncbi:MAG: lysophospholipid acyltransferase family protein [Pseudomonadota bacterium]
MLYLRSSAFYVGFFLSTIIYSLFGIMAYALPFRKRHGIITNWADVNLWWLAWVCKLHYRVEGLENLPDRPSVVMSNHQSTWETLALKKFFPSMSWVVKRELLWIPFFGWGLAATQPIAINRGSGQRAVEQLIRQARQRLGNGRWIMIFPEGTRVAPGKKKRYKLGGAIIASKIQVPVIPVAHNAGLFWRRRQFVKYPGTITVSIGPAVEPDGKSPAQINKEVKGWIEARLEKICAPHRS